MFEYGVDFDDPAAAYQAGVLVRDGGHLQAIFPGKTEADRFIAAARRLVIRRLPGMLVKPEVDALVLNEGTWESPRYLQRKTPEAAVGIVPRQAVTATAPACASPFAAPQFQVCEVTALGPAALVDDRRPGGGKARISTSVSEKEQAAHRFNRSDSSDIIGLIRRSILRKLESQEGQLSRSGTDPERDVFPSNFEHVGRSGYLAVITADGNSIGKLSKAWRNQHRDGGFFFREARGEIFFHRTRNIVRRALVNALAATFSPILPRDSWPPTFQLPFRLLMVGGDDLLLVCDAVFGPELLVNYSRRIADLSHDHDHELTVGAGMSIVNNTFPFHRSHALAEELASSAKRLVREREARGEPARSAVDWLSISESWHDDVKDVRRRDYCKRYQGGESTPETILLSAKPYPTLVQKETEHWSLERLWGAAVDCARNRQDVPRSQVRALGDILHQGRRQADWAIAALPARARKAIEAVCTKTDRGPLSAWKDLGDSTFVTYLLDFLELYELARLREQELVRPGRPTETLP